MDRSAEENAKIVEMDLSESRNTTKSRNSYSITQTETKDHRASAYYGSARPPCRAEQYQQFSPAPSAIADHRSPRTYSGHFEEFSFTTAQSSPQYLSALSVSDATQASFDYSFHPNYMANTESSRAKVRSQSAPRQRTDTYERQTSRRRPSVEGRNIPRGVRMQRSSSHVGLTANGYQYPWPIKLDRSSMSLKDSDCGSTSTMLTNTNYCRSLVGFEEELLTENAMLSMIPGSQKISTDSYLSNLNYCHLVHVTRVKVDGKQKVHVKLLKEKEMCRNC